RLELRRGVQLLQVLEVCPDGNPARLSGCVRPSANLSRQNHGPLGSSARGRQHAVRRRQSPLRTRAQHETGADGTAGENCATSALQTSAARCPREFADSPRGSGAAVGEAARSPPHRTGAEAGAARLNERTKPRKHETTKNPSDSLSWFRGFVVSCLSGLVRRV